MYNDTLHWPDCNKVAPMNPQLLIFLPLSMGRTCDLLLTDRIKQNDGMCVMMFM